MSHADIGMIGLAVIGQNLVMNMADHGFTALPSTFYLIKSPSGYSLQHT